MSGYINDPSDALTVNGVMATVNDDLTWTANDVPVNAGNSAALDLQVFDGSNNSLGSVTARQLQPDMVELMSYSGYQSEDWEAWDIFEGVKFTGSMNDTVGWVYNSGGKLRYHATTTNPENPPVTEIINDLARDKSGNFLPVSEGVLLNPPWEQASVNISLEGWLGFTYYIEIGKAIPECK